LKIFLSIVAYVAVVVKNMPPKKEEPNGLEVFKNLQITFGFVSGANGP
jgi:hypothetical protein